MKARRPPVEEAISSGGVVWRRGEDGGIEVVLCGRRADNIWGLPKGTPDANETIEQTATREVREETGLEVRLDASLGTIEYWFTARGVRYHKRVHHWLMEAVGGDVSLHDAEFDEVVWMSLVEARALVSYENERNILAAAAGRLGVPA